MVADSNEKAGKNNNFAMAGQDISLRYGPDIVAKHVIDK